MFRREREFNIISGQKVGFTSQRSQSCADQRNVFQKIQPKQPRLEPLGNAKDRKQYQYTYNSYERVPKDRVFTEQNKNPSFLPSMVNYVSTKYNIVNHTQQYLTAKVPQKDLFHNKLAIANRKNPLTGIIHAGRLAAPNYHADYAQREANRQFIRKRGICSQMCDIQKSYGIGKNFRNRK